MVSSARNELRMGVRPFYPELRGLGKAIEEDLKTGVLDNAPISVNKWAQVYGQGLIDRNMLYMHIRSLRMPTIEGLIKLGYLMKQSGVEVEIYDYLLIAADGIWSQLSEEYGWDGQPGSTGGGIPNKAEVGFSTDYAAKTYSQLNWSDRLEAMQPLLASIMRDAKFFAMTDDLEVIRELVKEAIATRQVISAFVAKADVPYGWIKNILDSKWDEVRAEATVGMVLKLADKVRNLDGKTGDAEFFAPLLTSDLHKSYNKEIKARQQ